MADGYSEDFHAWAVGQADAIRRRSLNEMDWENLAEEIESLGKSEARQLYSRLVVICAHLLKWRFQPGHRSNSWKLTINVQRRDLQLHLDDNPSLAARINAPFADAYLTARMEAAAETKFGLSAFPETPFFTPQQALDPEFWPEAAE